MGAVLPMRGVSVSLAFLVGLLLAAIKKYDIDPTQSFMIGDKLSDVQAGEAVGATGLLIDQPNGPIKPLIDTHILCES